MSYAPTPQQKSVIQAVIEEMLVKVEACAGSGKTSTLVLCAEAVKEPSLYLAFNKVTADEGSAKFPKYVTCRTTHSLAYQACAGEIRHKLARPKGGYVNVAGTGSEVARFYKIASIHVEDAGVNVFTLPANFIGLMVKNTVARFEQSADNKITADHVWFGDRYFDRLKKHNMLKKVSSLVVVHAQNLWAARINANSPVLATHDTYLKMYQLSKPVIAGYKVLYVDEFQDTTPCVLDIVMNQKDHMKIVMVGDARQAIYGWRGAVNAMLMVEAPTRNLTKSFRYGQAVADLASAVLEGDMVIQGNDALPTKAQLVGMGLIDKSKPYTRLFRTNAALLTAAVEELANGTSISIEIDVKDFVKVLESGEALLNGVMKDVKHDLFLPFPDWDEACAEAEHDPALKRICKLINEGKAREYIDILSNHVNSANPHVTFTTAHKSKGREWHQVVLEDDFRDVYDEKGNWIGLTTEEQNLLYVALTRAQHALEYNIQVLEYMKRYIGDDAGPGKAQFKKLMYDLAGEGPSNGHDWGGGLRGEQAQYAAEMQEGDRWAA